MKQYTFEIANEKYEVVIHKMDNQSVTANVNGKEMIVSIKEIKSLLPLPEDKGTATPRPQVQTIPDTKIKNPAFIVNAPIPGQVLEMFVKVGDSIASGQKILIMEAMKLENEINSPKAGIVKAINVQVGESVRQDQPLIELGE